MERRTDNRKRVGTFGAGFPLDLVHLITDAQWSISCTLISNGEAVMLQKYNASAIALSPLRSAQSYLRNLGRKAIKQLGYSDLAPPRTNSGNVKRYAIRTPDFC